MSGRSTLRLAVGLYWLAIVVAEFLSLGLEGSLPGDLRSWSASQVAQEFTAADGVVLAVLSLAIGAAIVASVGLFLLRRWGAWLWLAAEAACYLVYPFTGPSVEHPVSATFGGISILLSGFILGIAFFGNVLPRASQLTQAPAGTPPTPGVLRTDMLMMGSIRTIAAIQILAACAAFFVIARVGVRSGHNVASLGIALAGMLLVLVGLYAGVELWRLTRQGRLMVVAWMGLALLVDLGLLVVQGFRPHVAGRSLMELAVVALLLSGPAARACRRPI